MKHKLQFPSLFLFALSVVACSGDQLEVTDGTERAYLSAMSRIHEEIAPRYFAHVSGEFVDESVLTVVLNDVSNCDPDDNKVLDVYLRCVLSYFVEREGITITVSLDRYQTDGRSTSFKVNQEAPFTRWSFGVFDDSFTDGKETRLARLDVDENLQQLSNPSCVYLRGMFDESQSNITKAECELLSQEAKLFFESL